LEFFSPQSLVRRSGTSSSNDLPRLFFHGGEVTMLLLLFFSMVGGFVCIGYVVCCMIERHDDIGERLT
jgi:hypothetical protein